MILKLLRFILGYVLVEINGFAPERLINLLIKDEIVIWDVIQTGKGYRFYIGRKNILAIKPYLQKTNIKLNIVKRIGFPYLFRRNKKRAAFLIGLIFFVLIIYILSLFVWEVKVTGENHLIAEEMLKYIENNYIPLGTLKADVDCTELENRLRVDFKEISWISCELKGTGLTIHLEEGIQPDNKKEDKPAGDVIAMKNAVITKMITRQGTPVAKVKDKVKKGDILISGTVYIYDDNNEIIETSYISADGDIYGKTSYNYDDYVDLNFYDKQYKDGVKKYITLFVMDYCLTPYLPKMENDNYDTYTQIHKFRIFQNFYLPIGYKEIVKTPFDLKSVERTKEEAEAILSERLNKKIKEFEKNGLKIVKNNVKIEEHNNKIVAKGKITVIEPIAGFRKSGDNNE